METNKIYQGDCIEELKKLPNETINCVMTSPPYWALRDYGIDGQLGLEPTFQEYITKLCDIFDEVKRVLKREGTCWVNIGDTYASGGGASRHKGYNDPKYPNGRTGEFEEPNTNPQNGATEKSLCQIPSRFAIEMTNRGWILRNTIIWHKPNCMPSSIKDRFTVDFEYVFFFVKNKKYWFETQYEPIQSESTIERYKYKFSGNKLNVNRELIGQPEGKKQLVPYAIQPRDKESVEYRNLSDLKQLSIRLNEERKRLNFTIDDIELNLDSQAPHHWFNAESYPSVEDWNRLKEIGFKIPEFDKQLTEVFTKSSEKTLALNNPELNQFGRNKRTVWTITTKGFPEAHFATYPEELCETPLKAGCPEFVCNKCGKAREKIIERELAPKEVFTNKNTPDDSFTGSYVDGELKGQGQKLQNWRNEHPDKFLGYTDCNCNVGFSGGIVLDPFFGSGTTGLVALKQNKKFIGIELNPKYIKIAEARLNPYLEQRKL